MILEKFAFEVPAATLAIIAFKSCQIRETHSINGKLFRRHNKYIQFSIEILNFVVVMR